MLFVDGVCSHCIIVLKQTDQPQQMQIISFSFVIYSVKLCFTYVQVHQSELVLCCLFMQFAL